MKDLIATVKSNAEIARNIHMMTLTLPESVGAIHGGQFVNLSVGDNSLLLRRPLGIAKIQGYDISVCYQIKGDGTKSLSNIKEGQNLRVLLPLGNGFDLSNAKDIVVIGGGVGVFPLVATVLEYGKEKNFYAYVGFRDKESVCFYEEFVKCNRLTVTTDDGSFGEQGNAVDAYLREADSLKADCIIACGPPVMLKVLKQKLKERGITVPCYVSLEERMGCGIGACLVCTCKLENGENARVCHDGPVFEIGKVNL